MDVMMTSDGDKKKSTWRSFPGAFWVVILMEFFERGSYYGLMSVLSVYLVRAVDDGGLGFTKLQAGTINSTIRPLLYLLPILSGAIADRFGYRRLLMVAFTLLSIGYFISGQVTSYGLVFGGLVVMALGAGIFKPIISGTIARTTTAENSGLGFGIFYWSINLGAFLFPLVLVNYLRTHDYPWSSIFTASAIGVGIMLIPTIFLYQDPVKPAGSRSLQEILRVLGEVIRGAVLVLKDFRFISMIVIYSGFWILYFQMFDTVLWYLEAHVDMTAVNKPVNAALHAVGIQSNWHFDVEHVTVINAGTIITLQLIISSLVKNLRPLPTMVTGIIVGTLGFVLLSISANPWVFMAGIIVFSVGEMTAHPKYISYVGQIAPEDKKATYMGYAFLYGVIGSGVGGYLGASLYAHYVDKLNAPRSLWLIFVGLGVATAIGLVLYDKLLAPKQSAAK